MLNALTWICFILIAYGYFGYPIFLSVLPTRRKNLKTVTPPTSYTIIIAARNEESVIADRMENVLAAEVPSGATVEYLVCSDASDDRTHEIVESFSSRGVKLVASPERKGKEFAQGLAVKATNSEVLVFTDAKVKTEKEILVNLAEYFSDPEIGGVSSFDIVEAPPGGGSGEGMYVKYEMWLRELESEFYSLVGLSGSCFAVRKEVAQHMRADIPSDFALLIESIKQGKVGVLAPNVICTYKAVKTEEQEFNRKVRTVLRGITTLFNAKEVFDFNRFGIFTWQIISHKLGRWLVPWFLIFGTLGAFKLAEFSTWWSLVTLGLLVFYGCAIYAYLHPPAREKVYFKLPLFFMVTNAAILVAWIKYLSGSKSVTWTPSQR
jgi:cellulose synthase/poly-beta-1,6-N-acetylglucosamine synthase-like glycosyltransferase